MITLEMARAERRDLATFCSGLSPADWDAPSLCAGWRVRDVVAHIVSYEGLGPVGFAGRRGAADDLHGPGADVLRRRLR